MMKSVAATLSVLLAGLVSMPRTAVSEPAFAGLHGEVLLDNARVLVEKYVVLPGQSTGRHGHPRDQLLVFIKGGVLTSRTTGRSTLWKDGRVAWFGASDHDDDGSTNTGAAPIVMDLVTLKPVPPAVGPPAAGSPAAPASSAGPQYRYLNYPNIAGEDLLENDLVIVQRFVVNPGQWEGVHAHHPDMLYIHIKGGQWAARSKKEPEHAYPAVSEDGKAGWMPTIGIEEGHESRNIGKEPIDLIWVTLKK